MPVEFKHFIRMGSYVEKTAIERSKDYFDGIVVNANLVESASSATTSFIITTLADKEYFIDPIPFVFSLHAYHLCSEQIDRKTKKSKIAIKRSFDKLSQRYGPMIEKIAGNARLDLNDFSPTNIKTLAEYVIRYQISRLNDELQGDSKYGVNINKIPAFVLSPYFPIIDRKLKEWLDINKALIRESKGVARSVNLPLYGVMLLSPAFLDNESDLLTLATGFLNEDADGYLYWFDNMDEKNLTKSRVIILKRFIEKFQNKNKPIINMYGGYLSALLSKFGLTGVIHGVAYWESKPSKPISGGAAPPVKFYLQPIHERITSDEMALLIDDCGLSSKQAFINNICNCDVCQKVIKDDVRNSFISTYGETEIKQSKSVMRRQATENSRMLCRMHYLRAKRQEIEYVMGKSTADLKQQLVDAQAFYADKSDSLSLEYLNNWASIF